MVAAYSVARSIEKGSVAGAAAATLENVTEGARFLYTVTLEPMENEKLYAPQIDAVESAYGIPSGLLRRLLYQESRFRSDIIGVYPDGTPVPTEKRVVSSAGAQGIAQIVPRWHPGVDPWNPTQAIEYAGRYLANLYRQFGNWSTALAAYNWGPGNIAAHLRDYGTLTLAALPGETRNYVEQITADTGVA